VNELLNLGVSQKNIHFVLNRVGSKKTLNVEDVAEVVGIPVFSSLPNDYAAVSDASLNPDFHFGRSSANHRIASDAFIYVGLSASKETRRLTPSG